MTRIRAVRVTPIAFRDPPLLNVAGVHQPWALRSIVEVETADGRVGLGESYGDVQTLADLEAVRIGLIGLDVYSLNTLQRVTCAALGGDPGEVFAVAGDKRRATAMAAFEVPMLDLQSQLAGRPLYDILGGRMHVQIESAKMRRRIIVCTAQFIFETIDGAVEKGGRLPHQIVAGLKHNFITDTGVFHRDAAGNEFGIKAIAAFFEVATIRHLRDDVGRAEQAAQHPQQRILDEDIADALFKTREMN